ncbi:hypothetical protein COK69_08290 [Bacillus cereus]|nr:hypothetical protein BKK41_18055 [Bacillus cereus]PFU35376.1 hypothetical protein COK69_08290 [Bacillus cereus]
MILIFTDISMFILSRYLRAVKLPPQNSASAKGLGWIQADNKWGMNHPSLIKVALYYAYNWRLCKC